MAAAAAVELAESATTTLASDARFSVQQLDDQAQVAEDEGTKPIRGHLGAFVRHPEHSRPVETLQQLAHPSSTGAIGRPAALVHMLVNPQERSKELGDDRDILLQLIEYLNQDENVPSFTGAYILHALCLRCRHSFEPHLPELNKITRHPLHRLLLQRSHMLVMLHLINHNVYISQIHPLLHDILQSFGVSLDGCRSILPYLNDDAHLTADMVIACGFVGSAVFLFTEPQFYLTLRFFEDLPCNMVLQFTAHPQVNAAMVQEYGRRHYERIDAPVQQLRYLRQGEDVTEEVHDLMEELAELMGVTADAITSRMILNALAACDSADQVPEASLRWFDVMFGEERFMSLGNEVVVACEQEDVAEALWGSYCRPNREAVTMKGGAPLALLWQAYTSSDSDWIDGLYIPSSGTPFDDHLLDHCCGSQDYIATSIVASDSEVPLTAAQIKFVAGVYSSARRWDAIDAETQCRFARRILDGALQLGPTFCTCGQFSFMMEMTHADEAVLAWCYEHVGQKIPENGSVQPPSEQHGDSDQIGFSSTEESWWSVLDEEVVADDNYAVPPLSRDFDVNAFVVMLHVRRVVPWRLYAAMVMRLPQLEVDAATIKDLVNALMAYVSMYDAGSLTFRFGGPEVSDEVARLHIAVALVTYQLLANVSPRLCRLTLPQKLALHTLAQANPMIRQVRLVEPLHAILEDAEFRAESLSASMWQTVVDTLAFCNDKVDAASTLALAAHVVGGVVAHGRVDWAVAALTLAVNFSDKNKGSVYISRMRDSMAHAFESTEAAHILQAVWSSVSLESRLALLRV